MKSPHALLPLLAVLGAGLFLAPAASADEITATSGNVSATLTYAQGSDYSVSVTRNGQKLYDARPSAPPCNDAFICTPTTDFDGIPPLRVRDLDADGEPEVLVSVSTSGAHCCIVAQILALKADAGGYDVISRDFGNGGFSIRDLDKTGAPEFVSTDDSFAYAFTSYAFSGRPLVISRYDHGTFVDATKSFPGRVRADARFYWRNYKRLRRNHDGTARGQIAPWAADQYRLGKRAYAIKVLKREARNGYLGKPRSAAKFIKTLDRFLRNGGY